MAGLDTAITSAPRGRPLAQMIDHEARRRRRRRVARWATVAIVVVVAAIAAVALRPRPVALSVRFREDVVTRGALTAEVRATGRVEAVTTVRVGAEISGRIATVEVEHNARVTAGQVLARFDRAVLEAQLAQTRAALDASRAALEQARTDHEESLRRQVRAEKLWATGSLSAADHDGALAAVALSAQRLRAAESQLAAQRAGWALARTNLGHATIRSPIDGVVITRDVDPGQTVASVLQTPVLFTVAADLRKMRVLAAVDEADIGAVREGQPATFTVTAWPDRVFRGVVTEVRSAPVVVQNVVTYGVVVEVDNSDLLLKPGMTASVRVRTAEVQDALRVPNAALHFAPPGRASAESPAVWVLAANRLRRVAVQTGISDGALTEIRPGPLAQGERVLVELTPEGRTAYGLAH